MPNPISPTGPDFDPAHAKNEVYRHASDNFTVNIALQMIQYQGYTFEQALCLAVIELSKENERLHQLLLEWMQQSVMLPSITVDEATALRFKTWKEIHG